MAITPQSLEPEQVRARRRVTWARLFVVAALLSPLALDGCKVLVHQWQRMLGPVSAIETPALDYVVQSFHDITGRAGRASFIFRRLPWRGDYVVIVLALCAAGGMLFLRKGI